MYHLFVFLSACAIVLSISVLLFIFVSSTSEFCGKTVDDEQGASTLVEANDCVRVRVLI